MPFLFELMPLRPAVNFFRHVNALVPVCLSGKGFDLTRRSTANCKPAGVPLEGMIHMIAVCRFRELTPDLLTHLLPIFPRPRGLTTPFTDQVRSHSVGFKNFPLLVFISLLCRT